MIKAAASENQADGSLANMTESELRLLFSNMINSFSYYRMIYDEAGNPVDYIVLAVNHAFELSTGIPSDQIIGKSALSLYPETEQYWIDCFGRVGKTGISERITNYSCALKRWYSVLAYSPKPEHVAITVSDVTKHIAERESLLETTESLKRQEEENYRLAHIEPISGLPNRSSLYEAFAEELLNQKRSSSLWQS